MDAAVARLQKEVAPTGDINVMDNDPFLSITEVRASTGLGQSTIYRRMAEDPPTFPIPFKISPRCIRWKKSEIDAWKASLPRARS